MRPLARGKIVASAGWLRVAPCIICDVLYVPCFTCHACCARIVRLYLQCAAAHMSHTDPLLPPGLSSPRPPLCLSARGNGLSNPPTVIYKGGRLHDQCGQRPRSPGPGSEPKIHQFPCEWPSWSWNLPRSGKLKKRRGVGDSNLIARLSIPPERFLMRQNL